MEVVSHAVPLPMRDLPLPLLRLTRATIDKGELYVYPQRGPSHI